MVVTVMAMEDMAATEADTSSPVYLNGYKLLHALFINYPAEETTLPLPAGSAAVLYSVVLHL